MKILMMLTALLCTSCATAEASPLKWGEDTLLTKWEKIDKDLWVTIKTERTDVQPHIGVATCNSPVFRDLMLIGSTIGYKILNTQGELNSLMMISKKDCVKVNKTIKKS